jgi:hypothetical protein
VLPESFGDELGRIAVSDAELLLDDLAERPVRGVPVGETPAGAPTRLRLLLREPLPQLPGQPRLADTRVAEDRHEVRRAELDGPAVGGAEQLELGVAADEGRPQAAHAAGPHERQRADDKAAGNRLGLPLRLDRRRRPELEGATGERDGALAGEHLPRRCGLLESRRDVDRVAGDERAARARLADDHLSGVHADANAERASEDVGYPPPQRQRGMERPLGVVLVRSGGAEHRHDGVARELLQRAARELDLGRERVVEALEKHPRALGILLAEAGRVDEVGEQRGGELPLHARRSYVPIGCQTVFSSRKAEIS